MATNSQIQKRAVAYSFLAHIRTNGTFAGGPLDIFVPIVKNALSALYPEGTAKGANISEIVNAIDDRFALDIPIPVMRNILRLIAHEVNAQSQEEDMSLYDDDSFIIKKFIFEEYKEQIQKSKDEVSNVVKIYKDFCRVYNLPNEGNETDLIKFVEQNRADISYYLAHTSKDEASANVSAAQFVDFFRQAPEIYDTLRNLYLGSMLTSYLNYQPSNVNMGVEILLDTNFIVSLLDLNTPESTKSCNTFIQTSKQLGYTYTVLQDTIEEFKGLLSHKSENLDSAVIAKTINREDIYNACDRKKLTSVDLDRMADNIEETLTTQFGVRIIPHTDKLRNKARYSKEYEVFKRFRSTEKAALHDAMAILYVREKRGDKKIYEFDKVNCWFVNNAITHDNEHDEEMTRLQDNKNSQPEVIKVDNLLNIIWLSNPSIGINADVVDLGLASMVSYALNSTLPKARIIKELDENIQKYRKDFDITDMDVLRLSTRIVNRQIGDVQSLNELARKDKAQFAAKVKDESAKQEQIELARAQRLEQLMNTMSKDIDMIRHNKEKLDQKHAERLEILEEEKAVFQEKSKLLDKKEKEFEQHKGKLLDENKTLSDENKKQSELLHKLWKEECNRRKELRNNFIEEAVKQEQRKSRKNLIIALCFFVLFIIVVVSVYLIVPEGTLQVIDTILSNKMISLFTKKQRLKHQEPLKSSKQPMLLSRHSLKKLISVCQYLQAILYILLLRRCSHQYW